MDSKQEQQIRNEILKKGSKLFVCFLIIGLVCILVAIYIDIKNKNNCQYDIFWCQFYDTLVSSTTILAAAVIFFYSVQDNTKGGIPNRTILAYSIGSYTIPVFFMMSVFMLPFIYLMNKIDMRHTCDVCIIFAYILHFFILGLILLSNSYRFSEMVICNAEITQYNLLCEIDKKNLNNLRVNLKSQPSYTWSYMMYHFEQVILSDELIEEKISMIRRLLATPFYKNKTRTYIRMEYVYLDKKDILSLEHNNLARIYEYYYANLSAAMNYLATDNNHELRNKVYLVIYEFLSNLKALYQTSIKTKEIQKNYLMVVTSIMSAVLGYKVVEAEDFCCYIINNCIDDELRYKQITLYFLLQEYLYRTSMNVDDTQCIMYLDKIDGIEKWYVRFEDELLCWEFWRIWLRWTSISVYSCERYFYNAIETLKGEKISCGCLVYILLKINKIRERVR